jgi:hypothetical protein
MIRKSMKRYTKKREMNKNDQNRRIEVRPTLTKFVGIINQCLNETLKIEDRNIARNE